MDDKLYYVESPDEQVLGPMTMMHVLEGVAAGVILESARICEVGAQEWVYLSDITYTREEAHAEEPETAEAPAPASPFVGRQEPEVASQASWEPEPEAEPEVAGQPSGEAEPGVAGRPWEPEPEPEPEPESEILHGATWHQEPERSEPEHPKPIAPGPVEAPLLDPEFQAEEPFVEEPAFAAATEPEDPFEAPFDEAEDTSREDSYARDIEEAEQVYAEGKRRPKWLAPALAALALPAIAGAWLVSGRPIPFIASEGPAFTPATVADPIQEAREALVAGNAAEAMLRYEKIVAAEPDNAVAIHGYGMAAMAVGDPETAVASLEKACNLNDERPAWSADLALALHEAGRLDSALQRIDGYLTGQPEDRDRQLERLQWMLEGGQATEAAKLYQGLAKDNPVNAHAQYLAGLALGEDPTAETYLRRSIELDPAGADAHAALARVLAAKGQPEAARESLQKTFELRAPTVEERTLLASLDEALAASAPPAPAPPAPAPKQVASTPPAPKPEKQLASTPPAPKPEKQVASTLPAPSAPPAPAPKKATPAPPAADFAPYASRIREALAKEQFERAREILAEARGAVGSTRDGRNNAGLWEGIIAFEEGGFDNALAKLETLDSSASYRASGFGEGAVANWIARVWFAKGDIRRAIAALDGVGPADPDEYATARLWEGLALATLGMDDLAARTWARIPEDVGTRVRDAGRGAVKSAELLTGAISDKDYRTAVAPLPGFENDMYFFLAYAAKRKADERSARENFAKAIEESAGREFPYYLARAQVSGEGILGGD